MIPMCSVFEQSQRCRKGDPFQGPKLGSYLTLKWIVRGDTCADKARALLGQGAQVESRRVREARRTALPHGWQSRLLWWWAWFLDCLFLANHSDSEPFLVLQALFSQDGCQREGFLEVVGQVVSPFGLSWTLPVGGGLLVPCCLPGPPVVKQLMQMVTVVPGHGGRFQSVCFP